MGTITQSDAAKIEVSNVSNDGKKIIHLVLGEELISRFVVEVLLHGG